MFVKGHILQRVGLLVLKQWKQCILIRLFPQMRDQPNIS